ncbi:MAG: hypothetical protein MJY52_02290 [Bacteroidaceae bacterium]|nr:hypothetical protein [Bacteroidaceae bacterium]
MYIKKSVLAVYLVCALVVGYGACALFGTLSADGNLLSGDIAKADLYSGQKEDPDVAVVEEKLQNDAEFLKQTQEAMSLLKERLEALSSLTERTMSACGDVAEFQKVLEGVGSLQIKAYNATLALDKTEKELQKVADGKKSTLYEQASNNAYIGFLKTENQLGVGKDFVEVASKYLDGKDGKEMESLAQLVVDWTEYCLQDAVLNGSAEETAYWASSADKVNDTFAQLINAGELKSQMNPIFVGGVGTGKLTAVMPQGREHILLSNMGSFDKGLLKQALPVQGVDMSVLQEQQRGGWDTPLRGRYDGKTKYSPVNVN